jgi:hypothetical protein
MANSDLFVFLRISTLDHGFPLLEFVPHQRENAYIPEVSAGVDIVKIG